MRRRKRKRSNPSMIVLYNPSGRSRRTSLPQLSDAREAWEEFHEAPSSKARVIEIPDVRGLPRTVMSLGVCEGFEIVRSRSGSEKARIVHFDRQEGSDKSGPWLITDEEMKTLWVLSKRSDRETVRALRDADGMLMRAFYYWPPKQSGKHDRARAFRHELGETGEGGRLKREWPQYYTRCRLVNPQALLLVRPRNGYTVESRGVVG